MATKDPGGDAGRIGWLDHAKGICIILVVMLYATEITANRAGTEGWLHEVVRFAKPFRMPDFFLLSGLLLSLVIGRDWRLYLDRKVVHFAYFYVLWFTILFAFLSPAMLAAEGVSGTLKNYLLGFVHPYSMLWFIYLLPIFFVVTKLLLRVPAALVWIAAAALHAWQPDTGVKVIEKFTAYYVFFFTGYALAAHVFRWVPRLTTHPAVTIPALAAWALVNGYLVKTGSWNTPGVAIAVALAGCFAVMVLASWVSGMRAFRWLGYCGAHSIVIYVAFLIPLVLTRKALAVSGLVHDVGWLGFWAMVAGVVGSLAIYWAVRRTPLAFLFERPRAFAIAPPKAARGAPLPGSESSPATP